MRDKGRIFVALAAAFLGVVIALVGILPADAQHGASTFWIPTSGNSNQIQTLNYGQASGYRDAQVRNLIAGSGAASTTATDGFVFVQSGAGPPTGVPSITPTGSVPLYVDTTGNALYEYSGGAWHSASGGTITTLQPQTGTAASATGTNSTAVGQAATATGGNSTAVGQGTSADTGGTAVGQAASARSGATAISINAIASGLSTAVGNSSTANFNPSIAIGAYSFTTATNQFVAGSAIAPTTDVYFGAGVATNSNNSYTIHGTGSNTNGTNGFDLSLAGGLANQASDSGGSVGFKTAVTGAGTTLVDRVKANAVAKNLTSGTAVNLVQANVATDTTAGWSIEYTVTVRDNVGHHTQSEHGKVLFVANNENGTITTAQQKIGFVANAPSGTLTVNFGLTTGAGTATCSVTAVTTLTPTTFQIVYTLENDSEQTVVIQ